MGQRLGLAPRKPCGLTHVGGSQGFALPHRVGGRSVVPAHPPGQTRGPDLGVAGVLGVSLPPSCAPRGWRGLAPSLTSLPPPRLSPAPACASIPVQTCARNQGATWAAEREERSWLGQRFVKVSAPNSVRVVRRANTAHRGQRGGQKR